MPARKRTLDPPEPRFLVHKSRFLHHPNHPSKTMRQTEKFTGKSGLNLSQNAFLISASQKVRVRLSFERAHDHQTEKDRPPSRAVEAATSAGRAESCASAII
jgi:hypothetical protein